MHSLVKRPRLEPILIRLCDKFTRTEVNIICPVIKAENSVRILYKLQKKLLEEILKAAAGNEIGIHFKRTHWISSSGSNVIEGNLFTEYEPSRIIKESDRQTLKSTLEEKFMETLNGKYTLIDYVEDMKETVIQPIISEYDFELQRLKLCVQELNKHSNTLSDVIAGDIEYKMEEMNDSYTKFAVLSQNGKGKSFILNLLLLMTADNQEEYLHNNRDVELPEGFPNKVQWKKTKYNENYPGVVKDFIEEKSDNSAHPICYKLQYDGDTQTALDSFKNIGSYFYENSKLDLKPYILSTKDIPGSHESTTKCILHLRYGTCYQLKVEYFTAKELQMQLFELFTMEEDCADDNTEIKEKAEECLKARYEILTGREFTQEDNVISFQDVKLSKEVSEFAGKTELYVGEGKNSTKDRIALQNVLRELTTYLEEVRNTPEEMTRMKIAALKEIVVYLPSKLLYGGKEILEMPGTDESDPIAMNFIRNALSEVDAVILVTEYGFKICEKEVKDMLSESRFLQEFYRNPSSKKIMLIAYPEKNSSWQFALNGNTDIKKLDQEARKKKEDDLKTIAKMLTQSSIDHKKSIFTTYLLPVLHASILSLKNSQDGHKVISDYSEFLKYTGINDFVIQLDEWVLSRQKSSLDAANKRLEHYVMEGNNMTTENAKLILYSLSNKEIERKINEITKTLNAQLSEDLKKMLSHTVDDLKNNLLKEIIEEAKEQWNLQKEKISVGSFSPHFCGKNPRLKVRIFHVFFGGFENKKEEFFSQILDKIEEIFEEYKSEVISSYTTELNNYLSGHRLSVSLDFITQAIGNKLNDAQQGYMGKIKRPFNKKALEKLMDESQKESLKTFILEKNFKRANLDELKENTTANLEECIMNVNKLFEAKILQLHNFRFKSFRGQLQTPKGDSKIWKELELEFKKISRDGNIENLDQIMKSLNILMSASLNGEQKEN